MGIIFAEVCRSVPKEHKRFVRWAQFLVDFGRFMEGEAIIVVNVHTLSTLKRCAMFVVIIFCSCY